MPRKRSVQSIQLVPGIRFRHYPETHTYIARTRDFKALVFLDRVHWKCALIFRTKSQNYVSLGKAVDPAGAVAQARKKARKKALNTVLSQWT